MKFGRINILTREVIREDGEPYLVRYRIVDTPWFGIYLHHILKSDKQRDVHDHPWWYVSLLLFGGYAEATETYFRGVPCASFEHRCAPSIAYRPAEHAHRLILERPCWTLILRGRRKRTWGFHTKNGWVNFREYLRREAVAGRTAAN